MQCCHVGLHQAGGWPQPLRAQELEGREVNSDHLQTVIGQLPGRRYSRSAAQIKDPGTGPQQVREPRDPSGITADVLTRGRGRLAVVAAVSKGNGVIAAPDKRTLAGTPGPVI